MGSKFRTDRQIDRKILWHHIWGYVDFLFQLKLLPPYLLRSRGVDINLIWIMTIMVFKICWICIHHKTAHYSDPSLTNSLTFLLLLNMHLLEQERVFENSLNRLNEIGLQGCWVLLSSIAGLKKFLQRLVFITC